MFTLQRRLKNALDVIHYQASQSKTFPNSFNIISEDHSHDLSTTIRILKHPNSGAYVYNLINNDSNNCFAPVVKTLPKNDTGCPHILEHLACCGSQRYPIRDPFFNMLKRSTNTYMNAWTGQDFTSYPFSSATPKDFDNLYKVYLDLCLKPNLHQLDFRQEGWRYEYTNSTDGQQTKQIKGIVFNQMKGAYQNADRQLYVQINQKLFEGSPYQYDSGGKPQQIIKLSYEQILEMHKYYYHPSNTSFYFYGDADILPKLQFLESQYLSRYQNQESRYNINNNSQPIIRNNIYHECVSPTAQSVSLALAYDIGSLRDLNEVDKICLQILTYLLSQANPILFQQFVETGFASSLGSCGFEAATICTFKVILKNVDTTKNPDNISQAFYNKFMEILSNIIDGREGCYKLDESKLQELIVQNQLGLLVPKQNNGIEHLENCLPYFNNRLQLTNLLDIRSNMKAAVQQIKNKESRRQFINKYFIDNKKKVVIKQTPKKSKKQTLSSPEFQGLQLPESLIKKQQADLKIRQQQKQLNQTDCLPSLQISDLVLPKNKQFTVHRTFALKNNGQKHQHVHVPIDSSNLYFYRFVFRLPVTSHNKEMVDLLGLWKYTITKGMGLSTKKYSNKQLSQKLKKCCYDYSVTIENQDKKNKKEEDVNIIFSAACLADTKDQFLNIFKEILCQHQFKQDDCLNSFKGYLTHATDNLVNMPMQESLDLCSGLVLGNDTCHRYNWVKNGIKASKSGTIPKEIQMIFKEILSNSSLTIIDHSSVLSQGISNQIGLIEDSNPNQSKLHSSPSYISKRQENSIAVTHNYDVNFCTQQYPGPPQYSKDHASLMIFLEILEQSYLHPKIREQGGAYGARAAIRQVGTVTLFSYMDPYAKNTFQAFDESIKQLLQNKTEHKQLEEAKIKIMGIIDRPITPQSQCVNLILSGYSNQEKKCFREAILGCSIEDVVNCGKKYLLNNDSLKKRVVFGKEVPQGFIEEKLCIPEQQNQEGVQSAD